jgi:hypothetical protein
MLVFFFSGLTLMNRLVGLLVVAFLVSTISGCGGGITEGSPPEPFTTTQTPEFKDMMKKAAGKMMRKNVPKSPGRATGTNGS